MTSLSAKCPIGCGRSVQSGHLLCKPCWFKVPLDLRKDVWRTFRAWQNDMGSESLEALRAAQEAAIASVA